MAQKESPDRGGSIDVTTHLRRYAEGDAASLGAATALVYDELHRIAQHQLRRSGVGQQVDATVLVNEAYEKLARGKTQALQDRRHFFAIASRAMRQIVVDHYRSSGTAKRGAGTVFVTVTSSGLHAPSDPEGMVAVHQALEKLAEHNQDLVDTLDMACFGGLSTEEIAELTGCNLRTVQRKLQRARAWLSHFMDRP